MNGQAGTAHATGSAEVVASTNSFKSDVALSDSTLRATQSAGDVEINMASARYASAKSFRDLPRGDRYDGGWQGEKPHGQGAYWWADGSHYEGNWETGKKHGNGTYTWPSGAVYTGDWVLGFMQGVGTYTSKDGATYRGSWYKDEKHGLGKKVYANGDVYEGIWKSGKPDGPGMYRWADHSEYNGEWLQGQMHGRGTFVWPTKERYDGEWQYGRENGRGVFTWADAFFDGLWSNGVKHGSGVWCQAVEPKDTHKKDVISPVRHMRSPSSDSLDLDREAVRTPTAAAKEGEASSSAQKEAPAKHSRMVIQHYVEGKLIRDQLASAQFRQEYKRPHSGPDKGDRKHKRGRKRFQRKMLGETIFKGHRSYDLMLNLQLGIRWSVSRTAAEESERIDRIEAGRFAEVVGEINFAREGSDQTPPHPSGDFKWKDYCPMVFRRLRERWGIDAGDYMVSLCGDAALREQSSAGKSGSVFFLSHDDRFIIKTMNKNEMATLRSSLPKYYAHVMKHEHTLLTKFFGLHRVKPARGRKVRFVVMGNLLCSELPIHRRYDLKGSTLGRYTPAAKHVHELTILKDLDLDTVFKLEAGWRSKLEEQLQADCKLMEDLGVMDYSLLLGVHFRDLSNPKLVEALGISRESGTEFSGQEGESGTDGELDGAGRERSQTSLEAGRQEYWRMLEVLGPAAQGPPSGGGGEPGSAPRLSTLRTPVPSKIDEEEGSPSGGEGGEGAEGRASGSKAGAAVEGDVAVARALNHRPWATRDRSLTSAAMTRPGRTQSLRPVAFGEGSTDLLAVATGGHKVELGINMAAVAVPKRLLEWPSEKEAGSCRPPLLTEPQDVVISFGVIDFLQEYNISKSVEHRIKALAHKAKSISSIDPKTYSKRMRSFISQVFE